jgi:hypothetical protein
MFSDEFKKRFWAKVNKSSDCWVWTASTRSGYGAIKYQGKTLSAHRVSYIIHNGETDKCVLHKCNNRLCVNPDHLYAGTYKDNYRDMVKAGNAYKVTSSSTRFAPNHKPVNAKLNSEQVQEIRLLRKNKIKCRDIAKIYGICHTSVSEIANFKLYKNY